MKEIRELVKELERGIHDKVALMKMVILKCSDVQSNHKKIKGFINKGDVNNADK